MGGRSKLAGGIDGKRSPRSKTSTEGRKRNESLMDEELRDKMD